MILFEATREYEKKLIDPALLTVQEYRDVVDADHESHPSNAYTTDLRRMNAYGKSTKYETHINTITRHGIQFEIRRHTEDRWTWNWYKSGPDGEYLRDEHNNLINMDQDEIQIMIPPDKRYRTDYAIINPDDLLVAKTEDEWGCLLVMTTKEYQGFGFGKTLATLAWDDFPDRPSGGFTNSGYAMFLKIWDQKVREYLASGFYSHLVKTGQISHQRVKSILVGLGDRSSYQSKNLNTRDPKDWLLMTDGQSWVILYDKKIFDYGDHDYEESYWIDKHIIGMVNIAQIDSDTPAWINRVYGSDKIKGWLIYLLLTMDPNDPIRMEDDEYRLALPFAKNNPIKIIKSARKGDPSTYRVTHHDTSWKPLVKAEESYRKSRDPYGEWYSRIIEWAETAGE